MKDILKKLILLFGALLLVPCATVFAQKITSSQGFLLNGQIKGLNSSKKISLYYKLTPDSTVSVSTKPDRNGKFKFTGHVNHPTKARLINKDQSLNKIFYLGNTHMNIQGSMDNLKVTGSVAQAQYDSLMASGKYFRNNMKKLQSKYKKAKKSGDKEKIASVKKNLDDMLQVVGQVTQQFIEKHPRSYVSLYALNGLTYTMNYYSVKTMFDSLDNPLTNSDAGHSLGKRLEQLKKMSSTKVHHLAAQVEAHPDNLKLHQKYIKTVGIKNPGLEKQYKKWAEEFPKSAVVPYAIGNAYMRSENPEMGYWLKMAVKRGPTMAKAWKSLAINALFQCKFKKRSQYLKKAAKYDPDNAEYAQDYVFSLDKWNFKKYREKSYELAKRYSNSRTGAFALYWLTEQESSPSQRMKDYERLIREFPPGQFALSARGLNSYFQLCLNENPDKAVEVAKEGSRIKFDNKRSTRMWNNNLALAKGVVRARKYLSDGQPGEALSILKTSVLDQLRDENVKKVVTLIQASAQAASGDSQNAYQNLIKFFSKTPNKQVHDSLMVYGKKLDKSKKQVNDDIWNVLYRNSKPTHFKFKRYMKPGGYASLSDYRGKVILYTYWFPGCGPCRGEMPHFEHVIDKFSKSKVAFVGVNIAQEQNKYVIPYVKSSGFGFEPLEYDSDYKGNLTFRGAPTNYLIGPKGRIIFSHFRINAHNEGQLKEMIKLLINHNSAG